FSDLVKSKLKVWIANAFHAKTMTTDHEYIIETHGIVPVDYSCTGVVENYMKWSDGLHQFLEMKHQGKLSDMTAITNFMSNVGLLQKYGNQIYGMSGTLGQQAETETLQKIYEGIKTCQIPSFKRRKLFEVEGLVVKDEEEWIKKICNVVTGQTRPTPYRGPRAVLVICETINRAKAVHRALGDKVPNKKCYINNNMDNNGIFATKLTTEEVIIATNLAGRGTDLQVSDEVKTAGGLFVVQTFLPKNARVEAQAFGRTARQGSPGSAQLIVCSKHLSEPLQLLILTKKLLAFLENILDVTSLHQKMFVMQLRLYQRSHSAEKAKAMSLELSHILSEKSKSDIQIAKEVRDESVAEELSSYLTGVIPKIKKKEELFTQYLDILDEVYIESESKSLHLSPKGNSIRSNNKPTASEVSALNEFWGMWLLTSFDQKDSITDLKSSLRRDLIIAREKLKKGESPSSNLHHYTAFGNDLREKGNLPESIRMYSKATEADPCWAAIAYYNRAFTSLIQQNSQQDWGCIKQALEDLQNALKSVDLYCEQLEVTHRYSKAEIEDLRSDLITRFDGHIMARYRVLLFFKENIKEAIKKLDRARDMGRNVKVEKKL
uniref:Si:dkey-187j14.7 n=1 Tax=Acanthochromis polyacanthus TaxID=80966 RepID=A0A3Q1H697_9TELE